jgi:hypothetical protein
VTPYFPGQVTPYFPDSLSANAGVHRKAGPKPLLLGALLWITVAAASLVLQSLTETI